MNLIGKRDAEDVIVNLPQVGNISFLSLLPVGLSLDFSNISVHRGRESEKDVVLQ